MQSSYKNLIAEVDRQRVRCQSSKSFARASRDAWWAQKERDMVKPVSLLTVFGIGFVYKTPMTAQTEQSKGSVMSGILRTLLITSARGHILKLMGHNE
jgi:hypothetical protein